MAIGLSSLLTFLVPAVLHLLSVKTFDSQGYLGTICTYGFLLVYILISMAAPVYLYRLRKLRPRDLVFSILGVAFMLLLVVGTVGIPGSTLFPPPSPPQNMFPYLFLLYLAAGCGWFVIQRLRYPRMVKGMQRSVEAIHASFHEKDNF